MLYFYVKTLHIICAAWVIGLASALSLHVVLTQHSQSTEMMQRSVSRWLRWNWLLVMPVVLLQLVIGFTIIGIRQYTLYMYWVEGTFIGYLLVILSWVFASYCLMQYLNSNGRKKHYFQWRNWCLVALTSLIGMFFLMANRP
ncbi:MAG: DUF2269 family protein [Coxiellaceae bacterium]|nr:DUF2269 family protein [Coxiellaceae bacterium]